MAKLTTHEKNRRLARRLSKAILQASNRSCLYRGEPEGEEALKELAELNAKLEACTLPCDGDAHSNPMIDYCMLCMRCTWGRVPKGDEVAA